MDGGGNLLFYKSRGRPNADEMKTMKCSKKLKKELNRLKKEMNYAKGTEVLLCMSMASDEMMQIVHMHPEVFFMDVTGNTNLQKRDLFLMVVKDANGQTFVGNATYIPSGQRWVFQFIYQRFFLELYGEETMGRNRLMLTDDDPSAHGPLDNCIKTMDCFSQSCHMLCVFHAIVMVFHKKIYPKLPHKRGKNVRLLTEDGDLYGEIVFNKKGKSMTTPNFCFFI
jgi:hypothetical protein